MILVRSNQALGDVMKGGAGFDTLRVVQGSGIVTLSQFSTDDIELFDASGESVQGTSGADMLDFSGFAQVLGLGAIYGRGGDDVLIGSVGNDTLLGEAGNDVLDGGAGDDVILIRGNQALGDVMQGGAGFDTLRVIQGSGVVTLSQFSAGDIELFDASGEAVQGTSGADVLDFSGFAQVLNFGLLRGLGGDDVLVGSAGNETLDGGAGNDILIGGSGQDVFVFGPGFGNDTVQDFDADPAGGQDFLNLRPLGITAGSFASAVSIGVIGGNTLVQVTGEGSILLVGVTGIGARVVTIADFLLA